MHPSLNANLCLEGDASHWRDEQLTQYGLVPPPAHLLDRVLFPGDFQDDIVKITYAVSWLKGTAQRCYKPNLAIEDYDPLDFATDWATFLHKKPDLSPRF